MNNKIIILFTLLLIVLAGCEKAESLSKPAHTIDKFIDGDTLVVSTQQKPSQRVSLAYIDAPEYEQPYGREARKALEAFLSNKQVELKELPDAKVVILADGEPVNEYMVREGFAWPQNTISEPHVAGRYQQLKQHATKKLVGIWSLEHALRVPPWVWRKQAKEQLPTMNNAAYQQRMRQQQELAQQAQLKKQQELQEKQRMKQKDKQKN